MSLVLSVVCMADMLMAISISMTLVIWYIDMFTVCNCNAKYGHCLYQFYFIVCFLVMTADIYQAIVNFPVMMSLVFQPMLKYAGDQVQLQAFIE
uniref:Uncharacterized protein n=1 Tax=Arundo donax TaxID=35708 RepID=A0A0A8Y5M9_ARUDO